MKTKDGGPAFPGSVSADEYGGLNHGTPGMSLRDYFAAMALQGILAFCPEGCDQQMKGPMAAADAYAIADAMLLAREGKER